MKTFMITTALIASMATGAMAADFDNTQMNVMLQRDNLSFGLETVDGEATALTFGVEVLEHTMMGADASVSLGAEYGVVSEDFTFTAAYGLEKGLGKMTVYGDVEAAYTVASGSINGGWTATPTLGASYQVSDKLDAFGEVSYTWDVSNDWNSVGGAVEVGADFAVTETVALRPSLVRTFDTANDETNFKLEAVLNF